MTADPFEGEQLLDLACDCSPEDCPICDEAFDHEGYCEVPSQAPSPPPIYELKEAVEGFFRALDDPRHAISCVDLAEGQNVTDWRRRVEAILARL